MIIETVIIQAGSLIEWREGSGFAGKLPRLVDPQRLKIELQKPPPGLKVLNKRNGTVLWHPDCAGPSKVVRGEAGEADLLPQPQGTHPIEGTVSDPEERYLPRVFAFTLGGAGSHTIELYRATAGVRYSQTGGIRGRILFADGAVACWAMVSVTVTPALSPPLKFVAQADRHGEFELPLDRLPPLTKDAPVASYPATVEVKAARGARPDRFPDHAALASVQVATGKDAAGKSVFGPAVNLQVAPGVIAGVVSPGHSSIVIE